MTAALVDPARVRSVGHYDHLEALRAEESAASRVARIIAARWEAAGLDRWTSDRSVGGVPVPEPHARGHIYHVTRCTSPSGKTLFGCENCGTLAPTTAGSCPALERMLSPQAAIFEALLAGVRFHPDATGVPRAELPS